VKIRNIGILAHVDAGKTTLTEQLLYHCGALSKLGNVDKGTTVSDAMSVERERGISVQSSLVTFDWQGVRINLIDTPGHADFVSEVERSLPALDAAILVISAVEGVQSQTAIIWEALKSLSIPVLIFVNKIDRSGFQPEFLLDDLSNELQANTVSLQTLANEGSRSVEVKDAWQESQFLSKSQTSMEVLEKIASLDDDLMEKYIDDSEIAFSEVDEKLVALSKKALIFPLFFGLARDGKGVDLLLDAIIKFLPEPTDISQNENPSGVVYKIEHIEKLGKVCWVRLFGGVLKKRDVIELKSSEDIQKITAIKISINGKLKDVDSISSGEIAAVCGLNAALVGDIFGSDFGKINHFEMSYPLLTVQVKPVVEKDYSRLTEALQQLNFEDPALSLQWLRDEREFHLKINGWIQIEILEKILSDRYNLETVFESPTVIYKETPSATGFGSDEYTMPKPCWAVIKFLIEPGELGSGVVYSSEMSVDRVAQKYQSEVERSISDALKQGVKGWEVTDLKITFVDGEDHVVHSRPGNFKLCTNLAIMNGLQNIGTTLLEPIQHFRISAPEDMLGKIAADLNVMRATIDKPEIINGRFVLEGELPVATSLDYSVKLTSRSGGKARISTRFKKYAPIADSFGVVRQYKGISPLDRPKYILKMRNAIQ